MTEKEKELYISWYSVESTCFKMRVYNTRLIFSSFHVMLSIL